MDSWGLMHTGSYYINMQIYSVYESLKFMAQWGSKVARVRADKSSQKQVAPLHWEIFSPLFATWGCIYTWSHDVFLRILNNSRSYIFHVILVAIKIEHSVVLAGHRVKQ